MNRETKPNKRRNPVHFQTLTEFHNQPQTPSINLKMTFKITVTSYKDRHFPKQAPDYQIHRSKASQFLQNRSLSTVFTDNMQITDMGEVQPKKKNIGQNKRSTLVSETKWDPQNSQEQEHNPNMAQNTMELWQKVPTLENNTAWFLARGWFPWKYEVVFFSLFLQVLLKGRLFTWKRGDRGFKVVLKWGSGICCFTWKQKFWGFNVTGIYCFTWKQEFGGFRVTGIYCFTWKQKFWGFNVTC